MKFFGFPYEIRLKIYSEFLIRSDPIVFVTNYNPPSPFLFRSKREGLYSIFLRVNKKIHSEASLFLYSNNRFRFFNIFISIRTVTDSSYIALFIRQIGF
jgi:hypothetical protein